MNQSVLNHIDVEYSIGIIRKLSEITDNELVGNRSACSEAEHRAADFLAEEFQKIGLSNIHKDANIVDKWEFKKGTITFFDEKGSEKISAPLGGYATESHFDQKQMKIRYVGKGTEAEYETSDSAAGCAVLIDIDQMNDWWINFPAYEAFLHGAIAVICCNTGGFGQEGDETLVSEDICGPANIPVFSIGKRYANILKEQIEKCGGETEIILDTESIIEKDQVSYNVWGEIPGKSKEAIIIINHYDAYYRTVFDDTQGIGWALGIANAIIKSGEKPERTIRIVAHGAEEWGLINDKYDWAVGAFRQINRIRPEWQEKGFATMNLDGFYACQGETRFCIPCTLELYPFVRDAVKEFEYMGKYHIETNTALTSSTEDFSYARAGIPGFVAGAYDGCIADRTVLHSTYSTMDTGFDADAFELFHRVFLSILTKLDNISVRPLDMTLRFERLVETAPADMPEKYKDQLQALYRTGKEITRAIAELNERKTCDESDALVLEEIENINIHLHYVFKKTISDFVKLDWNDCMILPHERYLRNLENLRVALNSIEKKEYEQAIENLSAVDFNYYAKYFSYDTYEYFVRQVTDSVSDSWGTGLVENGNEDLFAAIRALMLQEDDTANKMIERSIARQRILLQEAVRQEARNAEGLTKMMRSAIVRMEELLDK